LLGQCPLKFFGENMNSNLMQLTRGKFLGVSDKQLRSKQPLIENRLPIVQLSIYELA
jgi:hypothetical protein